MTNQIDNKCTPGNCPFAPYSENQAWGMSSEGWAEARRNHEENHKTPLEPKGENRLSEPQIIAGINALNKAIDQPSQPEPDKELLTWPCSQGHQHALENISCNECLGKAMYNQKVRSQPSQPEAEWEAELQQMVIHIRDLVRISNYTPAEKVGIEKFIEDYLVTGEYVVSEVRDLLISQCQQAVDAERKRVVGAIDKDYLQGYRPLNNPVKLTTEYLNGHYDGFHQALEELKAKLS